MGCFGKKGLDVESGMYYVFGALGLDESFLGLGASGLQPCGKTQGFILAKRSDTDYTP